MIYVSARSVAATTDYVLSALSLADGHAVWTHDFNGVDTVGQPTVEDGHVYVAEGNAAPGTFMHSIAVATGAVEWSESFASQNDTFWAPLVVGGRIYFEGGEYGGLYALAEATGSEVFFANEDQFDSWSPLYLDNRIYTFTKGHLRMFDVAAGSVVTSTDVSFTGFSNSMNTSPVSDGTSVYIISPPSLYAFSPSLGAPLWTASGAYSSQPAIANGVLYSISGGQLEANDAATGAALWSFVGDKALTYPPVVAAGYVYVASDANAYAVDTVKHTQAWTAKPGGWLSIAAGRLWVASNNGTVVAWSLTQ
jgi:hypothetical protein